jgi:hypothetical protein
VFSGENPADGKSSRQDGEQLPFYGPSPRKFAGPSDVLSTTKVLHQYINATADRHPHPTHFHRHAWGQRRRRSTGQVVSRAVCTRPSLASPAANLTQMGSSLVRASSLRSWACWAARWVPFTAWHSRTLNSKQFVSYYNWYPDDSRGLRIAVAVLCLLSVLKSAETLCVLLRPSSGSSHIFYSSATLWIFLINHFGDIKYDLSLTTTGWWDTANPLMVRHCHCLPRLPPYSRLLARLCRSRASTSTSNASISIVSGVFPSDGGSWPRYLPCSSLRWWPLFSQYATHRIRRRMESVLTPSADVLHRHFAEERCCELV